MNKCRLTGRGAGRSAALALLLGVAGAGAAGAGDAAPLAEMTAAADFVLWQADPPAGTVGYHLSVSFPSGWVAQHDFALSEQPYFPVDPDEVLEDGVYGYELRTVSAPVRAPRLAASESAAVDENGRPLGASARAARPAAAPQARVQSGHFSVQDGIVVNPAQRER